MPWLPGLLGPYWPTAEIDVVTLSRADSAPARSSVLPRQVLRSRILRIGGQEIVGASGLEILPSLRALRADPPTRDRSAAARIFPTLRDSALPKLPRQSPTAKSATAIADHTD
jgi:hypothetical protein